LHRVLAARTSNQQLQKIPSARTIAPLMTTARDHLSKADTATIAAIEDGVPALVDARGLIDRFPSTNSSHQRVLPLASNGCRSMRR
jgi:hypothetical protein